MQVEIGRKRLLNAGTRIVKVMIDGRPIAFQPELSAWLGPEFIPIDLIERVEVAKGPMDWGENQRAMNRVSHFKIEDDDYVVIKNYDCVASPECLPMD